ncbi:putative 2-oxo-4-hydroxy-4-carboxy-5-ureidoimidazoline decarboxylase isoform X2 [Eulemur rufifrons]|uniref:putative 2-oxo-4-hydroxy-4-carboxy-5-ureidoimidazoline decarboxylase isoform X2 n=1 Tax=Eulemur rufifrons TaxID=859984 RepID=UPI0037427D79
MSCMQERSQLDIGLSREPRGKSKWLPFLPEGASLDRTAEEGQEGILRCHPDLAGGELQRGTLTAESQREQSGAGLTSLRADERLQLAELNAQYRARFGFPFVLAARLSGRAAVPRELARRLHRPPAQELRTALDEVKKIGRLRLADLFGAHPTGL